MTYDEFIQSIIDTRGQWNIPKDEYFEGHHIIPRCLGGEGKTKQKHSNIIWLTAKEHFIAHKLLVEKYPNNRSIVCAFSMMAFPKGKTCRDSMLSPEEYEEARKLFSKSISGENNCLYGKEPWNKGLTKETSSKIAEASKKVSKSKKGVKTGPKTVETRYRMSKAAHKRYLERPETFKSGTENKLAISSIDKTELRYIEKDEPLPDNFYYGNCKTSGPHDMSNYWSSPEMRRKCSERSSGKNNSMYGHGERVSGDRNGHAIHDYFLDDMKFSTKLELWDYLNNILHIKISKMAITRMCNNEYTTKMLNKYKDLPYRIRRELKDENNAHN